MIHVGIAGWDYPDWAGIVYPEGVARDFDRLSFVSQYVDVIEINSTFYRPADPRTAEGWVRRTRRRPGFLFTAKAHRSLTHEPDADLCAVVPETLLGLAPLRDAGVLGAVLIQFPQSFHHTAEAFDRLSRLAEGLDGWPVVLEVRHTSWDSEKAAAWCRERGIGWCVVDQPHMGGRTLRAHPRVTAAVGYMRLHGRNGKDWFRVDAGRDARYDYLYSLQEMAPLAETAHDMARQAEEVFVVQNNHFRGKALVNALYLKHLLGQGRPLAPDPLVRSYPELQGVVRSEQAHLF